MLETQIQKFHGLRENRAQIIQHAVDFTQNIGPLLADLPGAPQPLQRGFQAPLKNSQLQFGETPVVTLHQQQINGAVMFQHGHAFGFGGMRGQHRFGGNPRQHLAHLRFTEAALL